MQILGLNCLLLFALQQVIDREEEVVARIIVSSNICVTGDIIDLKFYKNLDVRLKVALLAATVIIVSLSLLRHWYRI